MLFSLLVLWKILVALNGLPAVRHLAFLVVLETREVCVFVSVWNGGNQLVRDVSNVAVEHVRREWATPMKHRWTTSYIPVLDSPNQRDV